MRLRFLPLLLSTVISFICIHSVKGQEKNDLEVYELFDISLEELLNVGIVSASKKKQSVLDAPATAYVITEDQIQMRNYTYLLELLEDIPEVEVQRNSNNFVRNQVSIRGVAGNEKFLILLNGIRITPYTDDSYALSYQYSLVNVKRVEVIIGPASALYGADAFSGIINIVTKSQDGSQKEGVEGRASYGSYNTTNNSLNISTKFDKLRVSVGGSYYYSGEPNYNKLYSNNYAWYNNQYQPNGQVVESPFFQKVRNVSNFQTWAGGSFYGDSLSRGFSMPTRAYYVNAEANYENFTVGIVRMDERHSSAYSIDPKYTDFARDAFIEMSQQVIYGRHLFTSFNKKWRLQSTFSTSYFEINPHSNYQGSVSRWQRGFIYGYNQTSKLEEQFQYEFSRKTSLTIGASYEYLSALPKTAIAQKPIDPRQPVSLQNIYFIGAAGYKSFVPQGEPIVFNDSLTLSQQVYNLHYKNFGSYAQLQFRPLKFLEVTLGTRFDYNTRYGGRVNPRVGLVAKPLKNLHLKVLYGEAFLAPSPDKAYQQSGSFYQVVSANQFYADYFAVPNPNLKPEKLRSLEGSINYFLTSNINLAANAYFTSITNLINIYGVANQNQTPGKVLALQLGTAVNSGLSEVYGGSFRVNILNKIGSVTFNPYASYTYMDGNINHQVLLYTAKNTVKGGIDVSHKRFSMSPRITWRTGSYTSLTDGPGGSNFKNPPFYVINLAARYWVKNSGKLRVSLFTNISNLMNRRYYNVVYGTTDGMPLTPQDPFRIMGGFNFKFM